MPYNDDSHHVVKTSAQWDERAIEFWVVPRGCLCVELTPEGKTKIKIGEGNKFYSQLPYVNDMSDLENYYTKEEVDNIVTNINLMAIRSTDEYDTKNDLPSIGNKLGDVRFVKSPSPSIKTDPDIYLWNGSRWIYVGYELQDIDLSQYLKKDEFHELFDPIREKVEEMYPKMHTHENKSILDRIEEPYSTAEKEKLAGLENYDDTEIRELIAETGHTHPNKPVLDTITDDSLWSESDRTKFESLHNYDDTGVRNRLTDLESAAHTHSNKNILDQVTAAFTVEDKTKLDSLHNNEVFIGTDGMYGGREGLVPAPTIIDAGKFLCADGTWKAAGEIVYDFRGATASEDGTNGLVPAPLAGEQSYYLRGDGTWAKVKQGGDKYKAGDGIYILSDEVISDTFPLEIFAKSSRTSQYVVYGSAAGVGEWDGTNYVLSITVAAEGETTLTTQILYNARLYTGDYVDYSRQIIHHAKEDMRQYITLYNDPTYGTRGIIQGKTGQIAGNYNYNPGVMNYIEVTPGEIYWVKAFPDEYIYFDNSYHCIFDENYNVTRYFAAKGAGAMTIEIQPGEKYARFVGKPASGILDPGFLYRLTPYEEPCVLPSIVLYPNKINTIDVANTNKPSEIYIEAVTDEPDDPDDPMSKYTGIIYNEGVLDIAQEHPDSLNKLTVHFRETEKVLTLPEGNKYKSGDGIYILAGDASSTTLPVEIYAKANKLKQYVLYGGTDPVGDWDSSASKYVIPIKVSAEGMSDMSTSVLLDDPIGNGDYIDYANQQFVHTRTNMTFSVRSGEVGRWIHADGTTTGEYTYQDRMAPSDYIAVSSEYVYLYYPGDMHGCDQFGIPCYAALYDENKVFTRSILLRSFTEVTIEPQPGEAYMRVSYGYYQGATYRLTKIGEVVTPIVLPPVLIYANKVNTIDVMTTNKPAEIYVETAVNSGSEDPMADITGIIYNDGILDVTQEDPNALNELTFHYRDNVDKVITIPAGGSTYTAGDGIDIDANDEISAKLGSGLRFDANGAIETTGEGGTEYAAGQGIVIEPSPSTRYTEIEYLKSTGTQYIKTDIMVDYTMKTELDMFFGDTLSADTTGTIPFGVQANSAWYIGAFEYGTGVYDNFAFYDGYKWSSGMSQDHVISGVSYNTRSTIIIQRDNCSYGADSCTLTIPVTLNDPINPVSVFGVTNAGAVQPFTLRDMTLYSAKIYDSHNNVIHDLVPVKRIADNVVGLYDTITNKFYTNIGTGSFVAGNDIGPVQSDSKFIDAKLGNGLSFDQNDAIQVNQMTGADGSTAGTAGIVPAPTATDNTKFLRGDGSWAEIETSTKYAEGDAIEFSHPGMTDLGFDFDTFVSKFTPPNNGIVSVDSANKAFTLTATGSDCYTNPWVSGSLYTIPVIGGRKYRLTWNSNASNVDGTIYAFENASTSHMHAVNQADQNYLEFTADTSSNVNFRFGVTNSGNSITFSNIKFYEIDNADPDTNIINVKYGNGLSLDNSNRLQANTMTGADGTNAGTAGIVPAPTATDNTKFLKGDGTWSNPPTYTLPIASSNTLGGIKVGNNLTIDANGVLSATGGSGGSYTAGDGIDIEPTLLSKGFSYTDFINSVSGNGRGTLTKNNDNSFTMTATDDDFFTNPFNLDQGISGVYIFSPVEGEKTYRLTWDSSDRTVSGRVFVFENGRSQPLHYVDQSTDEYLEFTTASGTTSLSFRFGVENTGDTLTYSNIELYEVVSEPSIISAKLGDGLDFDSNDAIEVKLGNGLQFDTNGAIESTGEIINYIAGDGIDISRETVDPDYYFESQVTCRLTGSFSRSFTKTTSEPAFGALITGTPEGQSDHWTGPLFVGKTSTSVERSYMVTSYSMEYLGETWYYGDFNYFVDGDLTDLNNNLVNLSGVYENTAVGRENAAKALIDAALAGGRDKVVSVVPATTTTLGGVKVGAGLSMNANDELGVTSPYVTSVANQGSVPGVITVAKSDGTSSDVDILGNLRLILNCNYDSTVTRSQLGDPVNAPQSGRTVGSPIMGDLTIIEVDE